MDILHQIQNWPLQSLIAVIAGLVILLVPRVLNYAIAAYLLAFGAIGLLHFTHGQPIRPQTVIALVAGVLVLIRPNILSYIVGIYLIVAGLLDAGMLRF